MTRQRTPARPGHTLRWVAIALAAMIAIGLYYHMTWPSLAAFTKAMDWVKVPFSDFRGFYQPMAAQIVQDPTPVPGYFYPAFLAVALHPVAIQGPAFAVRFWMVFTIVMALGGWVVACRLLRCNAPGAVALLVMSATAVPVLHCFNWGQVSILLTSLTLTSLWLHRRGNSIAAGLILSLAIAVKIYPAIFLWYFLISKDRRALLAAAAGVVAVGCLFPGAVLGFGPWWSFETAVFHALRESTWGAAGGLPSSNSQTFAHVIGRWLPRVVNPASSQGSALATYVGYAIGTAMLVAAWQLVRRRPSEHAAAWSLIFVATPFVLQVCWPHYLCFLPVVQLVAFGLGIRAYRPGNATATILQSLPVVSIVLSSIVFFNLFPSWHDYMAAGMPFLANALLVPSLLVPLLTSRSSPAAERPELVDEVTPQPDRYRGAEGE